MNLADQQFSRHERQPRSCLFLKEVFMKKTVLAAALGECVHVAGISQFFIPG
jgi:hypothetical protein